MSACMLHGYVCLLFYPLQLYYYTTLAVFCGDFLVLGVVVNCRKMYEGMMLCLISTGCETRPQPCHARARTPRKVSPRPESDAGFACDELRSELDCAGNCWVLKYMYMFIARPCTAPAPGRKLGRRLLSLCSLPRREIAHIRHSIRLRRPAQHIYGVTALWPFWNGGLPQFSSTGNSRRFWPFWNGGLPQFSSMELTASLSQGTNIVSALKFNSWHNIDVGLGACNSDCDDLRTGGWPLLVRGVRARPWGAREEVFAHILILKLRKPAHVAMEDCSW